MLPGGGVLVGAFHGSDAFMEAMASKMALGVQRKLDRLSNFPNLQGRFFMARLCLQGTAC